jgi:hypothetical protein
LQLGTRWLSVIARLEDQVPESEVEAKWSPQIWRIAIYENIAVGRPAPGTCWTGKRYLLKYEYHNQFLTSPFTS